MFCQVIGVRKLRESKLPVVALFGGENVHAVRGRYASGFGRFSTGFPLDEL